MSTKIMLEIARHSTAKGNAKLVLLLLASYAHPDGTHAEMSLSTIAREAGISRRQVNTIVHFLAETGHVRLEPSAGAHGTNRYAVQRLWLKEGNHFPSVATSPGAITAPLGKPLPTIDKENKDLKTQSDEAIALGQSLPHKAGQSLPQQHVSSPPAVTPEGANWVRTFAHDLGQHFSQVLQGVTPQDAEGSDRTEEAPVPTDTPAPPPRTPREPALYFQGKLCPRGHDDGTGHTLRRVSNGNCTECDVARTRAKRQAQAAARAQTPKPPRRVIDLVAHRQAQGG
jgi:hypothetical protein